MDDINSSSVDKIAALARLAAGVKSVGNRKKLIAVPTGVKILSEDSILNPGIDNVASIDRNEHVGNPQSFIDFVESYGTTDTAVFVDSKIGKALSIINYIPKSSRKTVKTNSLKGYRCDWQVNYHQSFSDKWEAFDTLTDSKTDSKKAMLLLASLKDFFFEIEFDRTIDETSLRSLDKKHLYSKILDAQLATEADIFTLLTTHKSPFKKMLANFAFPIHQGSNAVETIVLIEQTADKLKFEVLDKNSLVALSTQHGMSKIKTKLQREFEVFEADLTTLSKL